MSEDSKPYSEYLPDDLDREERHRRVVDLLAVDFQEVRKQQEKVQATVKQVDKAVNNGLTERTRQQAEQLEELEDDLQSFQSSLNTLHEMVQLGRELVVPTIRLVGGGILLWLAQRWMLPLFLD